MSIQLSARSASLQDVVAMLQEQSAHKVDVVVSQSALHVNPDGLIEVSGIKPIVDTDGVTDPNGIYRPTDVGYASISDQLGIPSAYMKRMLADELDVPLFARNANHWLKRQDKPVLIRLFTSPTGEAGVFRAMLSNRYRPIDNFDTMVAVLSGLRESDVEFTTGGIDIDEKKMRMTVEAPAIKVVARELLKGYRSPFTGQGAEDLPFISAGFSFSNSETGNGSLSIMPRAVVQVCKNGMTRNVDVFRQIHVGGRMSEGIRWEADTDRAVFAALTKQVRDVVSTYCSEEYLLEWVASLEEDASKVVADPTKALKVAAKSIGLTESEQAGILNHFIMGGQPTAGGLMQATTSFAQTIDSPLRAVEVEEKGEQVMRLVAAL